MWVEPDTNVPSGESLVRQVTFGARFFAEEFGVESDELWIPDVFGYSAALPQIAARAGMRALITQKLSWNDTNHLPHTTFWWEGLDGSRLLTHFPPADTYNGVVTVDEIAKSVERLGAHGTCERSLYPFGFGDGGGGPNRYMLEFARRVADLDGLPRTEIGTVDAFLDDVTADPGRPRRPGSASSTSSCTAGRTPRKPRPSSATAAARKRCARPRCGRSPRASRAATGRRTRRTARASVEAAAAQPVPRHPSRLVDPLGVRGRPPRPRNRARDRGSRDRGRAARAGR